MLQILKTRQYYGIMAAEESVLIAEVFHIVCIFRKEGLMMMIGAKVITGERQIELKQNNAQARGFVPIGMLELFHYSMRIAKTMAAKNTMILSEA